MLIVSEAAEAWKKIARSGIDRHPYTGTGQMATRGLWP